MRDKKYNIAFDDFERRITINCLNKMRNKLIADIDKQAEAKFFRLVQQMTER